VDTDDDSPELPLEQVTLDQIVAINMRYYRRAASLTQEQLGRRLGWSAANVSAAERSASEDRDRRRFDAHTLAAVANALGVPLIALFFPPEDDGYEKHYLFRVGDHGDYAPMARLMMLAIHDTDDDTPAMGAYRERLRTQADAYLGAEWGAEVGRWLAPRTERQTVKDWIATMRSRRLAKLDEAAELEDMADAMEVALLKDLEEE
jgi:transcriptional regulator with XRE-family HTH domain